MTTKPYKTRIMNYLKVRQDDTIEYVADYTVAYQPPPQQQNEDKSDWIIPIIAVSALIGIVLVTVVVYKVWATNVSESGTSNTTPDVRPVRDTSI